MLPSNRNNSDNISIVLGIVDIENPPISTFIPHNEIPRNGNDENHPRFRPLRPPQRSSRIELSTIYEEKIQNLESKLAEYELTNIEIMEQNDKYRENLSKLIESYPKKYLFEKIIENKCSICLEEYKYGDEIAVTNCMHLFHKVCIDKSIEQECIDCPNCRFKLTDSVFLYLKFNLEMKGTDFF